MFKRFFKRAIKAWQAARQTEMERYLADSTSLADLETRMRHYQTNGKYYL